MSFDEEIPLQADVFIANHDGTGVTQLTSTSGVELFVRWQSSGERIILEMLSDPRNPNEPEYYYLVLTRKEQR